MAAYIGPQDSEQPLMERTLKIRNMEVRQATDKATCSRKLAEAQNEVQLKLMKTQTEAQLKMVEAQGDADAMKISV